MKESKKDQTKNITDPGSSEDRQAIDKAPGEERSRSEKLSENDLKGKKVDADPSREMGRPAR